MNSGPGEMLDFRDMIRPKMRGYAKGRIIPGGAPLNIGHASAREALKPFPDFYGRAKRPALVFLAVAVHSALCSEFVLLNL